jgi:hypothetical protein
LPSSPHRSRGCARACLGSVQQRRIQPAGRRIHVQLFGPESSGASQQQRRVQSTIVCWLRLYHRLARRPGRFPQPLVAGAARLSGGAAACRDICPPTALLCRRLRLDNRSAAPATDLGRRRADTKGKERAGTAGFGAVDCCGLVGSIKFSVVAGFRGVFP